MDITSYLLGKKAGGGGTPVSLQDKEVTITENGETEVTADSGYDGLSKVDITTNVQPNLETLTETITSNTTTTFTPSTGKDGFSSVEITTNIPTGSLEPEEKDVNFYDYDGTRVYSYTKNEFLALNDMPANPTHSGLTAQGWNWDFSDAQTYVTNYGMLDVGQNYVTDDGDTRLYVDIEDESQATFRIGLGLGIGASATIDWGDGTTSTLTGSGITIGLKTTDLHTYSTLGEKVIKIRSANNAAYHFYGDGHNSSMLICYYTEQDANNNFVQNVLKKVEIGSKLNTIKNYGFQKFSNLETITIPNSLSWDNRGISCYNLKCFVMPKNLTTANYTYGMEENQAAKKIIFNGSLKTLGQYMFNNNNFIDKFTLPRTTTTLSNYTFANCGRLKEIILPDSITSIGNYTFNNDRLLKKVIFDAQITSVPLGMFSNCYSLTKLKLPKTITTINQCFDNCKSLRLFDFSDFESIPTVNTNQLFESVYFNYVIVVPDALYENWITASVWLNVASHIVRASDYFE